MIKMSVKAALAATVVAAMATPLTASAASDSALSPSRNCFISSQWHGWSSPSRDVLLLRVNVRDIYRVQLTSGSHRLRSPDAFLVSRMRGSNMVCSAIDLDLAVSEPDDSFASPLIARTLTKLSPEEIAAIPKRSLP